MGLVGTSGEGVDSSLFTSAESSSEEANNFIGIGEMQHNSEYNAEELAAYTVLANTILNMTESILKG